MTSVFSDHQNETTISELTTESLEQFIQSKDAEPIDDSKVLPKMLLQQNEIKIQEIKTENDVQDSEVYITA